MHFRLKLSNARVRLDSKSDHLSDLSPFSNLCHTPVSTKEAVIPHLKYMTISGTLNYRQGSALILYFDYNMTLAFMKDSGQILDLFNMQYNRLVIFQLSGGKSELQPLAFCHT